MGDESQHSKNPEAIILALNKAIQVVNVACKITNPATLGLAFASALLETLKESLTNGQNKVELTLLCYNICRALELGNGMNPDEFSRFVGDKMMTSLLRLKGISEEFGKMQGKGWNIGAFGRPGPKSKL